MLNINWKLLNDTLIGPPVLSNYRYDENSMRALDTAQQSALESLRMKYPHTHNATLDNTLDDLNAYLLGKTRLSADYTDSLSEAQKLVYYQDIFHTAYRCLIRLPLFNARISPAAEHAKEELGIPKTTDFLQEQLETIAAIWKALNDESFPLAEGHTREYAKELFSETLSDIGRTHNRDNNAEQDDMKADSPSCSMGINQRLVQFIMIALREEESSKLRLDAALIKQLFQEHLISENQNGLIISVSVFDKIEKLNLNKLNEMREALNNLAIMSENTPKEKELLTELFPWTTKRLVDFIVMCKSCYGEARFTSKLANNRAWLANYRRQARKRNAPVEEDDTISLINQLPASVARWLGGSY